MSPTDWFEPLLNSHRLWGWFLAAFLGGLALNLTPCVYPMIPVTVAFFSNQSSNRLGTMVVLSGLYMIGMAITYAVLGLLASQTGALFGSWLQHPAVLLLIAALMTALAMSLFGWYELRPPAWIAQRLGQAQSGGLGALVMGLTVGVIAAPCIGPFVLGLLLLVSELARPWLGFWLLFTLGIGMGLPYMVIGIAARRAAWRPKAGEWLVWIKQSMGSVLLGAALFFLKPLMAPGVFHWLVVIGLIASAVYLGWLERSPMSGGWLVIRRATGIGLLIAAAAVIPAGRGSAASAIHWQPYTPARLEQAKAEGRPVIIDVYADWCVPCIELDRVTFRHPAVAKQLAEFTTLRVDATREVPKDAEALLDRYQVFGVPTILIVDAAGREREELRVNGFVPPQEFLARLAPAAAKRSPSSSP